ncbi:hypothetical protein HIM_03107 [Hirsutella minnesotensis 3608]|nr:hypothetical protein HIM_03107 [Hirsutella minnesotensis 3608]
MTPGPKLGLMLVWRGLQQNVVDDVRLRQPNMHIVEASERRHVLIANGYRNLRCLGLLQTAFTVVRRESVPRGSMPVPRSEVTAHSAGLCVEPDPFLAPVRDSFSPSHLVEI